jgi:hypothetical protein
LHFYDLAISGTSYTLRRDGVVVLTEATLSDGAGPAMAISDFATWNVALQQLIKNNTGSVTSIGKIFQMVESF